MDDGSSPTPGTLLQESLERRDSREQVLFQQLALLDAILGNVHRFEVYGSRVARMLLVQTTVITVMLCFFALKDAADFGPGIFERLVVSAALVNLLGLGTLFIWIRERDG